MRVPASFARTRVLASGPRAPTVAAVLAAGLLIGACTASSSTSPSPSSEATATPVASPAAEKLPGSVTGVLARLYLALNWDDSDALAALSPPGAMHAVYYTDGTTGEVALEQFDIAADPLLSVTPFPDLPGYFPMTAGNAVAIPVRYHYPVGYYYGFDLLTLVPVGDEYLIGDAATFYGPMDGPCQLGSTGFWPETNFDPDPECKAIVDEEVATWNAGSVDQVMATYTDDAAFWDGVAANDRVVYTGNDLRQFVTDSLYFQVHISGGQFGYGTFVASPNRLSTAADSGTGISVHEIRDGRIALHVWLAGD